MVKKILIGISLFVFIINPLFSENIYKRVNKEACLLITDFPDKNIEEIKQILINKAKLACINEIYGESLFSNKIVNKGKLSSFLIKSNSLGIIHISGNPRFYNGKNLGEICVSVNAYITKSDYEKLKPKTVNVTYCYTNENYPVAKLKKITRRKAYLEIIKKIYPNMQMSFEDAKLLVHNFKINNEKFNIESGTYCINCSGDIIPFEVKNYNALSKNRTLPERIILNQLKWNHAHLSGIFKYSWFCKKYCDKFICKKFSCDYHICNDCVYFSKKGQTSYSFILNKPLENGGDIKFGIYFYPEYQEFTFIGLNIFDLGDLIHFKKKEKVCKMKVGHFYLLKDTQNSYLVQINNFNCREIKRIFIFSTMECEIDFKYIKISPIFKNLIGLFQNVLNEFK